MSENVNVLNSSTRQPYSRGYIGRNTDRTNRGDRVGSSGNDLMTFLFGEDWQKYGDSIRVNNQENTMWNFLSNMPVIGGLFSGFADANDKESALMQSEREMLYNAYQAELNRKFQAEQIEKANEYNSIGAQIKRAVEAGVSPNAVVGNPYNTSESANGSSASYSGSLSNSLLTASADTANKVAQNQNMSADTANKLQQFGWDSMSMHERYESLVNMNDHTKAQVDKLFHDMGIEDKDYKIREAQFGLFAGKTSAEIQSLNEQLNVYRNQCLDILSQIKYRDGKLVIEGEESVARIAHYKAQTSLITQQKENEVKRGKLFDVQLGFSNATGIPIGANEFDASLYLWSQGRQSELTRYYMYRSFYGSGKNVIYPFGGDNVVPYAPTPDATAPSKQDNKKNTNGNKPNSGNSKKNNNTKNNNKRGGRRDNRNTKRAPKVQPVNKKLPTGGLLLRYLPVFPFFLNPGGMYGNGSVFQNPTMI